MEKKGFRGKWKTLLTLYLTLLPCVQGRTIDFQENLRNVIPFILGAAIICTLLGILCWFQCRRKKFEKCCYVYCKKNCFSHETLEDPIEPPSGGAYTQQTLTNVVTHNCQCQSIMLHTTPLNEDSLRNKAQNFTKEPPSDTYVCPRHTSESSKNDQKSTGNLSQCQCKVFQQTCSCDCQPPSGSTDERPVDKYGPLFTVIS